MTPTKDQLHTSRRQQMAVSDITSVDKHCKTREGTRLRERFVWSRFNSLGVNHQCTLNFVFLGTREKELTRYQTDVLIKNPSIRYFIHAYFGSERRYLVGHGHFFLSDILRNRSGFPSLPLAKLRAKKDHCLLKLIF